jgi:hypothetical protein
MVATILVSSTKSPARAGSGSRKEVAKGRAEALHADELPAKGRTSVRERRATAAEENMVEVGEVG